MPSYKTLTVSSIKEEVAGVKSICFDVPAASPIQYKAGQHLTFVMATAYGEIRRSYSITSAPTLGEPLSVAVKKIENGTFSRFLVEELQTGDKLLSTGAGGFFTLPEETSAYQMLFFFAAGSGITPVYGLIKTALHELPHVKVVLVYSNSSPATTIFLDQLQKLQEQFKERFIIEFLYSSSKNLYKARLHKDLLKSLVKKHAVAALAQGLYYLCGPYHYMLMCTYGLTQLAVPAANIRKETFTTGTALPKTTPPDTRPWQLKVRHGGKQYVFAVQYPESILSAARKAGLVLPYSCEGGRCGNCVAHCQEGKVWMLYNEVLTERELKAGLVLTCTGYPVGGNVTLAVD